MPLRRPLREEPAAKRPNEVHGHLFTGCGATPTFIISVRESWIRARRGMSRRLRTSCTNSALSWNLGLGSYVRADQRTDVSPGPPPALLAVSRPTHGAAPRLTARPASRRCQLQGQVDYERETVSFQRRETFRRLAKFAQEDRASRLRIKGRLQFARTGTKCASPKFYVPVRPRRNQRGSGFRMFRGRRCSGQAGHEPPRDLAGVLGAECHLCDACLGFSGFRSHSHEAAGDPRGSASNQRVPAKRGICESLSFREGRAFGGHFEALLHQA